MNVFELTAEQRAHLAWQLDHKTGCGYRAASRIGRGEMFADRTLAQIFEWAGMAPDQAATYADAVANWRRGDDRWSF